MQHLTPIAVLFGFLLAGLLMAKINIAPPERVVNPLANVFLYLLLFFMGFRIGRNDEARTQIGEIGIQAVVFAVMTVVGTAVCLMILYRFLEYRRRGRNGEREENIIVGTILRKRSEEIFKHSLTSNFPQQASDTLMSHFAEPLRLFSVVIAGFLVGAFIPILPELSGEFMSSWALRILLLLVGMQLVQSGVPIGRELRKVDTILLPSITVVGSWIGGLCAAWILGMRWNLGIAVASGFGWYSLSGVIISDLGNPVLGSAAFLGNIMRETLALITIPFIAQTRYPRIGIGVAGATAMDVSLPLIDRSCGPESVPLAIATGGVLSLLVPVFVPLFYGLG